MRRARTALLLALALPACAAWAESVTLTGTVGQRAILIVGGGAPRTLAPGESLRSVRLISVRSGEAVVEVDGQRSTLRMDQPVSVGDSGSPGGGARIVLPAGSGGHFMAQGAINGRPVQFMLDTGATLVGLSAADAQRIGIDYRKGQPVQTRTANGVADGYRLKLDSVRVGDVEVRGVDAIVTQQAMPYVLLGNSFTNRFSMRRDADQMVLERRY